MATVSSTMLLEDSSLGFSFNRALHACPEVIASIYAVHYHHVLRVCRRFFRQPEDAEDAASEVFLKLHTVLPQKDTSLPFRPWVSQVAGRHCIDKLRKRGREKYDCLEREVLDSFVDRAALSPLSQVLLDERRRRLRKLLSDLPEQYRVPLFLRYYKHMSYSQIARILNRQLPAVRSLIFRAKRQLRRNLHTLD